MSAPRQIADDIKPDCLHQFHEPISHRRCWGVSGSYGIHGSAQFIAFRCAHFRLFDYIWNLFDD